jgi:8-oxo-dGTP diphosphatase
LSRHRLFSIDHPRPNDEDTTIMTMNQKVKGVVAAIRDGHRWLMIQRADHIRAGGAWCFPGGTVEPNEPHRTAVVRELMEELSLVVQPHAPVWRWCRQDNLLELEWWHADIISGNMTPDPSEVQQARWMTLEQIRKTPNVLPNNLLFLNHVERCGWPLPTIPSPAQTAIEA